MRLKCDMYDLCESAVAYIDEKGFVYCETHGKQRKTYCRCRKLKPTERKSLENGQPIMYGVNHV